MSDAELSGPRLVLRLLSEGDVTAISNLVREPGVAPWWTDTSEAGVRAAFLDAPDTRTWAIIADGAVAGAVSAFDAGWPPGSCVGLAIALRDAWQGLGLGPEALSLVIADVARERGVHRFTVDPAAANLRAIDAYAKVGFRPVGVARKSERAPDGTWGDCLLMDLLIEEFIDRAIE